MVARSPNSERKMQDDLPDVNVAAEFYARYDIREVLGKFVFSLLCLAYHTHSEQLISLPDEPGIVRVMQYSKY